MKTLHRRAFLRTTAASMGGSVFLSRLPSELFAHASREGFPVGFQTWTVREDLAKDFAGTLKMMAGQGYQLVEMCSPKGYVNAGFGPLLKYKPAELRTMITDAGLQCPSCHFGFNEFADEVLEDRIAFAHEIGLRQMICSSFGLPKTATLNDFLSSADKLNKAAEKIKAAGLQAGYHNHSTEFALLDGQLIYEALLKQFDPNLVKMQFQTEVINLGYKAATYFTHYPGRFISAHLSDWTADKKQVPVGQGVIDWKEFFAAAKTGGVRNFFVEMEPATFRQSAAYLHSLQG